MKFYENVKSIREQKKLSQEAVAFELGLSQSQYSKREHGQIPFSAAEMKKLSKILDSEISELYGINANSYDEHTIQHINILNKLIDQYEKRIEEKDNIIAILQEQISNLKRKD